MGCGDWTVRSRRELSALKTEILEFLMLKTPRILTIELLSELKNP